MTRTFETFAALALTILTVFALWTSTLATHGIAAQVPATATSVLA